MRPTLVRDYLGISSQEIEILELLKQGFKNSEIASKLEIGNGTTRNYISSIYEKLEVRNRQGCSMLLANTRFFVSVIKYSPRL